LEGSIHTIKKNAEALVVAITQIGLEVNSDKTKYTVMSRHQKAGRSRNIKTDNRPFTRFAMFEYLGKNLTNENSVQEEINGRLKSGNACYHSVQNLLSPIFLSNNLKIKILITIILSAVLYGCGTWSPTLRDERGLRVLENRLSRRIFRRKRDEVKRKSRKLNKEELNVLHTSIVRVIKSRRVRLAWHVASMGERRGVLLGNLREIDHLGDPGVDGWIIFRCIFRKWDVGL